MKKIILLFATAIILLCLPQIIHASESIQLDYIREYRIDVKVLEDSSLSMNYHLTVEVLDDSDGVPLSSMYIRLPNSNISDIQVLSDTIYDITYKERNNKDYAYIQLRKLYFPGDVVELDFQITHHNMYEHNLLNRTCTYTFTPGWFKNIKVGSLIVTWEQENVKFLTDGCVTKDNSFCWETSLDCNERFTVFVTYDDTAYDFNYLAFWDSYTKTEKAFLIFFVIGPVLFSILYGLRRLKPS